MADEGTVRMFSSMTTRPLSVLTLALVAATVLPACAQQTQSKPRPEDTEVWTPVPKVVTPGITSDVAPSDAIVLFDGHNLDEWIAANDGSPAKWTVASGVMTVNKPSGDIETKRRFGDYQLHIEWRIPADITGKGKERGNSGVYLAMTDSGGYELQVMDSYENPTYVNGQAASMYKQYPPLVNAARKPGEWQAYDVVWTAPRFNTDGSLKSPAYVTAIWNGVLVQNHVPLKGVTLYIGTPAYHAHGAAPILLQAHGDPSAPISYRNIWVRPL